MDVYSQYVTVKLERICSRGARGKVLSIAEIERAMVDIMIMQNKKKKGENKLLMMLCRKRPLNHLFLENPSRR